MPALQTINFGADPYANAVGGFAKNFLSEFNERTAYNRNENIFNKIKEKYGKDADPQDIFRDVLEAEGLDQDYKRNKLAEIKEYAALSSKSKLTPYQSAMLDIREEELELKKKKAEDETISPAKLPGYIAKQTNELLKGSETTLKPHEKSELNSFIEQLMTDEENPLTYNDAFNKAYEYILAQQERIKDAEITKRPTAFFGQPNSQDLAKGMEQAYQEIKALYEQDGIDNQTELRKVLKDANWQPPEINKILQRVFAENGRKLRGPQSSGKLPMEEQGTAAQAAGIDDILFGE